ncbi:STAS-like domain-containing protein [Caulobacter sp. Root487D2Y]|uniref:STAS-like domain-containing protein n=1 Tax=Caulobacter sp. Root487D2Y TaxID=1736547 RepID=UPI0009EA94EE|nr:STAS-like domain-containing protein [Caulobacter sp. Root487D2Y]
MTEVHVAEVFSPFLGGRYRDDGPWSGEEFRDDLLLPRLEEAFASHSQLVIILDGVAGVPSSFLEEAFGGLLRARKDWTLPKIEEVLVIQAGDPELLPYVRLAHEHMKRQALRQ